GLARDRVRAELAQRRGRSGAAPPVLLRLGEDRDGLVDADREELLLGIEAARLVLPLEVGPVAPVRRDDLAALGVLADDAGQREQLQRLLEGDRAERHRLEERRHLRLLAL